MSSLGAYFYILIFEILMCIIFQQKPSGPVDFASELAKKIGGAPVIKPPSPVAAEDHSETETTGRKGNETLISYK